MLDRESGIPNKRPVLVKDSLEWEESFRQEPGEELLSGKMLEWKVGNELK